MSETQFVLFATRCRWVARLKMRSRTPASKSLRRAQRFALSLSWLFISGALAKWTKQCPSWRLNDWRRKFLGDTKLETESNRSENASPNSSPKFGFALTILNTRKTKATRRNEKRFGPLSTGKAKIL